MSHQFRNNCVGCFVGVSNVVHTFRDNVLFFDVCNDRGDGVSVDREIEFILASGNFVFHVECFLVVGESGEGDPGVLESWFDVADAIQGSIVCDAARLFFADNEGEDAAFSTVPFGLECCGDLCDRLNQLVNCVILG